MYAFALLSGLIFAFDASARQAFVAEVVPASRLRAAIALNAAVFQSTRLIGPAIATLLIASVGTGWVFAVNAACYAGPVGTPIGAPVIGVLTSQFGPRTGMALCGAVSMLAAAAVAATRRRGPAPTARRSPGPARSAEEK